ncbi:MAG: glycosyltransferase family 4 protein [Anaerolineae bacterium]
MRIALFHNLPSGGAKRHTYEQVRELGRRGHQVDEYTLSSADLAFTDLRPYVGLQHVEPVDWRPLEPIGVPGVGPYLHLLQNGINLRRLARVQKHVAEMIDGRDYDLVFVKDCGYTLAPYLLRYITTPSVFYAHSAMSPISASLPAGNGAGAVAWVKSTLVGWPARAHHRLVMRVDRANARKAGRILTNSVYTSSIVRERYGVAPHVVYPGVDTQGFAPTGAERGNYVLSVGALTPYKGHELAIDAVSLLPARIRPSLVVAAASGSQKTEDLLYARARAVGVELTVSRPTVSDMPALYSRARALLACAEGEPLGLTPLESMACATPVVAVQSGGYPETVRDGETGFVVERTAHAIADALSRLLPDHSLTERMGAAGRRYVEAEWTWQRAVDRLEEQFAAVLAEAR